MNWTGDTFTLNHPQDMSKFIWKRKFQHRGIRLDLIFPRSLIYTVKREEPLLLGLWACCSITSNLPCFLALWRRGPLCFQPDHCGWQDPFKGFPYSGFSLSPVTSLMPALCTHMHMCSMSMGMYSAISSSLKDSGYHNTQLSDMNRWLL